MFDRNSLVQETVRWTARVLSVFRGRKDEWGLAYWFASVNSFLGGKRPQDLLIDEIPGRFDVIWYSNVLHIYSPEQNLKPRRTRNRDSSYYSIECIELTDRSCARPSDSATCGVFDRDTHNCLKFL